MLLKMSLLKISLAADAADMRLDFEVNLTYMGTKVVPPGTQLPTYRAGKLQVLKDKMRSMKIW